MTLRNIISYIVYSDFVSENLLPIEFSCNLGGQSPVNLSSLLTGAPVYIKASKTQKQNRQVIATTRFNPMKF